MSKLREEINSLKRAKDFNQLKTMIQSRDKNDVRLAIEIIKSKKKYPTIARSLQQEYNWEEKHGVNWHGDQAEFIMYEVYIDPALTTKDNNIYLNIYSKVQKLFKR